MEHNHIHFGHNHDPHNYFIFRSTPKCVPPTRGTNIIKRVKPSRTRRTQLSYGQPNHSKAADKPNSEDCAANIRTRSRHENKRGIDETWHGQI